MYIYLKDRSKKAGIDEIEWYEKAFGKKRNMMQMSANYVPLFDAAKKGLCDFYILLNYKIFPELEEEPEASQYSEYKEKWLLMEEEEREDDKGNSYYSYSYNLELPNGDWKFSYYYKLRNNEQGEKLEIPEEHMSTFKIRLEPEPISQE